jgi:hypothetical protein
METKKCSKCNQVKPISEFYKNASMKDGLQGSCKDCQSSANRERAHKPLVTVKPEAIAGVNRRPILNKDNPLSAFTPRELMQELHKRGYEGELMYTSRINIAKM